ncbi:MAG: hypothetical protein N2560_04130 [Ignavibacteria bacterium]|nr:hypothetical protein [Ignavibacteria bacterium]
MDRDEETIVIEQNTIKNEQVDVASIVKEKRNEFGLVPLFDERNIDLKKKLVRHPTVIRPHFALSGYTKNFVEDSILIFGRTEIEYLNELEPEIRYQRLKQIANHRIPCLFFTNYGEYEIENSFIDIFLEKGIPVFGFRGKTPIFVYRLMDILDDVFAPKASLHGNLVEVFSVGILIIGDSGIGKSELTMELVAKGHLFVADDLIFVIRKFGHKLLGYGNQSVRRWIEIRGAGIFDITQLFGVNRFKSITEIESIVFLYSQKNLIEKVHDFMFNYIKSKQNNYSGIPMASLSETELLEEYTKIPDSELIDAEYKIYKRILKYSVQSRFSSGTFPGSILEVPIVINPIDVHRVRDVSVIVEAIASRINSVKYHFGDPSEKLNIKTGPEHYLFPPNYYKED